MIKKINLLRQEHYVAPALESLVVDAAGAICVGSPDFGDVNEAGAEVEIEQTLNF